MPDMADVVMHEMSERDDVSRRQTAVGEAVGSHWAAAAAEYIIRHRLDDPCEVSVVGRPYWHELRCGRLCVLLKRHPYVLFVRIDDETLRVLVDDEAPVVVASRVDEVADDFARAPLVRGRPPGGQLLRDTSKQRGA